MTSEVDQKKRRTPRNYKEVKALSNEDLKYFCTDANIPWKTTGRDALDVILCDTLGISTTGSRGRDSKHPRLADHCLDGNELSEFKSLTPAYVQTLDGWTKDIRNIPDIDIGTVKKYLEHSNNLEFTRDSLKKYKLSRSYAHVQAKHVHSLMFNFMESSETFCIVKAQCLPSQSGDSKKVKWLHVILDKKTGDPYGGFCICTVGTGQACSHIGALLFILTELIANGKETLPEDKSCTDVLCHWTDPKGAQVTPKPLQEIDIKITKVPKADVRHYAPQVAPKLSKEENYQRVLKLIFDVRNANTITSMPPVVNIIDIVKFRQEPLSTPDVITEMPEECSDFNLPVNYEEVTTSYPLPVYRFPHKTFTSVDKHDFQSEKDKFIESIIITKKEAHEIEQLTRNQSYSDVWFDQRKGSVTGSKVQKIISFLDRGKSNPDLIVKDIMQYNVDHSLSFNIPALAWGLKNEDRALSEYVKDLKEKHKCKDVEIIRPGLLVNDTYAYIRVSPDAIIVCSCHGRRLVEVKCPYSLRNKDIEAASKDGNVDYVEIVAGQMCVKKGHCRGYYEQITLQQALAKEVNAELLIWTKVNYVIVPMKFDDVYWENKVLPSLKKFFCDYIVPEILTERIRNNTKSSSDTDMKVDVEIQQVEISEIDSIDDACVILSEPFNDDDDDVDDILSVDECLNDSDACADDISTDKWTLGCQKYCRDTRAPSYS